MTEIYWITRLDSLSCFFGIIAIITGLIGIIILGICIILYVQNELEKVPLKKIWMGLISTCIISSFILIFIPSTKDMYMIYGVGSTIDYLKENETAKQLPDKCIKYLDKWVDENLKEEEKAYKEKKELEEYQRLKEKFKNL